MKLFALTVSSRSPCTRACRARISSPADEIQVKQLERAWNQAEMKQEVGAVASLLSDTLVYTDYDGSFMNKKEYMKWIAAPDQRAITFTTKV